MVEPIYFLKPAWRGKTFCRPPAGTGLTARYQSHRLEAVVCHFLWKTQSFYIVLGSLCVALAAALFYRQRSALAWFYGQISLSIESPAVNGIDTEAWYKDADSWATWIPYQSAFTALVVGCWLYLYALTTTASLLSIPFWLLWSVLGIGVPIQVVRMLIYRHYKYEDDPIGRFFRR